MTRKNKPAVMRKRKLKTADRVIDEKVEHLSGSAVKIGKLTFDVDDFGYVNDIDTVYKANLENFNKLRKAAKEQKQVAYAVNVNEYTVKDAAKIKKVHTFEFGSVFFDTKDGKRYQKVKSMLAKLKGMKYPKSSKQIIKIQDYLGSIGAQFFMWK